MSLPEEETHASNSDPTRPVTVTKRASCSCRADSDTSFRGVRRRRWGRYVSEIRLPGKKTRVWLGSFGSAEMAARAYDSAAWFLKGDSANLNFPHLAHKLPRPESSSRRDIQLAAAKAAHDPMTCREGCETARGLSFDFELEDSFWDELLKTAFLDIEAAPIMSPRRFELVMGE